MSVQFNIDSVVKPLASLFNIGMNLLTMNLLTKQFHSSLSRKQNELDRLAKAAHFNYDVKVSLYNLASVYAAYKATGVIFGFSSLIPALRTIALLLLVRKVIDSSMSVTSTAAGSSDQLVNNNSIISLSMTDSALSTALTTVKLSYKLQTGWAEELLQVGGVTIFKNWHLTIPALINHIYGP